MKVRDATDADEESWDAFVHGRVVAPPLALYRLRRVLQDACRAETRLMLAAADGAIRGVLMTYVVRSRRGRKRLFSPSYGLLAQDPEAAQLLMDEVASWCATERIEDATVSAGYDDHPVSYARWERHTVVLRINPDPDATWRSLRDKTRNAIRKGGKSGLELLVGHEFLPQFYEAYRLRLTNKCVPFLPRRFFEQMIGEFGDSCQVFVAANNGAGLAGMLVLFGAKSALYFAGGATPGTEPLCANHFLMWQVVQACSRRGVTSLDMGESREGGGVYRFKTLFGGTPRPLSYYRPGAKRGSRPTGSETSHIGPGALGPSSTLPFLARIEYAVTRRLPARLRAGYLVRQKLRTRLV